MGIPRIASASELWGARARPRKRNRRGKQKGEKPSQPEEAWAEWERDEMEKLLNEVRGHLGGFAILVRKAWANVQ